MAEPAATGPSEEGEKGEMAQNGVISEPVADEVEFEAESLPDSEAVQKPAEAEAADDDRTEDQISQIEEDGGPASTTQATTEPTTSENIPTESEPAEAAEPPEPTGTGMMQLEIVESTEKQEEAEAQPEPEPEPEPEAHPEEPEHTEKKEAVEVPEKPAVTEEPPADTQPQAAPESEPKAEEVEPAEAVAVAPSEPEPEPKPEADTEVELPEPPQEPEPKPEPESEPEPAKEPEAEPEHKKEEEKPAAKEPEPKVEEKPETSARSEQLSAGTEQSAPAPEAPKPEKKQEPEPEPEKQQEPEPEKQQEPEPEPEPRAEETSLPPPEEKPTEMISLTIQEDQPKEAEEEPKAEQPERVTGVQPVAATQELIPDLEPEPVMIQPVYNRVREEKKETIQPPPALKKDILEQDVMANDLQHRVPVASQHSATFSSATPPRPGKVYERETPKLARPYVPSVPSVPRTPSATMNKFDNYVQSGEFSRGLWSTERLLERSRSRSRERQHERARVLAKTGPPVTTFGSRGASLPPGLLEHRFSAAPSRSTSYSALHDYADTKNYELNRSLSQSRLNQALGLKAGETYYGRLPLLYSLHTREPSVDRYVSRVGGNWTFAYQPASHRSTYYRQHHPYTPPSVGIDYTRPRNYASATYRPASYTQHAAPSYTPSLYTPSFSHYSRPGYETTSYETLSRRTPATIAPRRSTTTHRYQSRTHHFMPTTTRYTLYSYA